MQENRYIQEDEIDLRELFKIIWDKKNACGFHSIHKDILGRMTFLKILFVKNIVDYSLNYL